MKFAYDIVIAGGGMVVSVSGLSGPTVQPNDTGFKVNIDQQGQATTNGLETTQPVVAKSGGVVMRYPLSVSLAKGIG